jgi:hypothetical protein
VDDATRVHLLRDQIVGLLRAQDANAPLGVTSY